MSTIDVTNLKSKLALAPTKFYDKDDKGIGTLCRAWVYFTGVGTVTIRASFNVSSITDNNTGDYTINLTNSMPDTYYCVTGLTVGNDTAGTQGNLNIHGSSGGGATLRQVNRIRILTGSSSSNTLIDKDDINVAIFR